MILTQILHHRKQCQTWPAGRTKFFRGEKNFSTQSLKIFILGRADNFFLTGFSFTKTPAKLEVKTKKKVFTSFLSNIFLAAVSLSSSTAPKLTHYPYFRVIFALCDTNSLWLGVRALSEGFQLKPLQPPCIRHRYALVSYSFSFDPSYGFSFFFPGWPAPLATTPSIWWRMLDQDVKLITWPSDVMNGASVVLQSIHAMGVWRLASRKQEFARLNFACIRWLFY